MDVIILIQGIIEIVLSILTGLFVFNLSLKFLSILTRDIDEIKELNNNNVAVAILGSAFVFGIMLLVKTSVQPAMEMLKNLLNQDTIQLSLILLSIVRILLYYLISATIAFLILWLCMRLFILMTIDLDEIVQIKNNNIAISFLMSSLIISISLILTHPIKTLLSSTAFFPRILKYGIQQSIINIPVFLHGIVELSIATFVGLLIFYLSYKVIGILIKRFDEMEEIRENNVAVSLLYSSFIFGIMILMKATILPVNDALVYTINSNFTLGKIALLLLKISGFFCITCIIAFLLVWLVVSIFIIITREINEIEQIKNNNISIAIITGTLIIVFALLLHDSLSLFLTGLIGI